MLYVAPDPCLMLQGYLNLNRVQSCSLGPFVKTAYIMRKMTLSRAGVWMGESARSPCFNKFQCFFRHDFLTPEDLEKLDTVRDIFLGPAEDMTSSGPIPDPDNPGRLKGGTAFERCGQRPVKDSSRCYSLTMTHQRARGLVGPTGAGKFYSELDDADDYSLNLEIRGKVTKVCHRLQFQAFIYFKMNVCFQHNS